MSDQPQAEMPRYKCHKEVWALKIKAIEQSPPGEPAPADSGGTWLLIPEDPRYGPIKVTHYGYFEKHSPKAGGYYVVYDDGYQSYSPASAFEGGYAPIEGPRAKPTESEIAAVSTAPRVTKADLDANISAEYWLTADKALGEGVPQMESLKLLTLCILVLKNGMTIVGTSACASPENFNADIGHRLAREDAVRQVWPLMGYELRSKLAREAQYGTAP